MRNLLLLTAFFFMSLIFAQAPAIVWQKNYGGTSYEYAKCIKQTADGGFVVAGYTASVNGDVSSNHGGSDFWILKLNASGDIVWQKTYGGTGNDVAESIAQTTDGGYIVAGSTNSIDGDVINYTNGSTDFWVIKIDSVGTLQWQSCEGGSYSDRACSVVQTTDGGCIVVGNIDSTATYDDYLIIKYNSIGTIQWFKIYGSGGYDFAKSVQQTTDGGYIVAGYSTGGVGNHGSYDIWILKLSSTGTIQWQKCLGGSLDETAYDVKQTNDGKFIITGQTNSYDGNVTNYHGSVDIWVVLLNSDGTIQWQKTLGGTDSDISSSVVQTSDNGFLISGYVRSSNGDVTNYHGNDDGWLAKLSSTGVLEWQRTMGGSMFDYAYSAIQATDGSYVLVGSSQSSDGDIAFNHGSDDLLIVKFQGSSMNNSEQNSSPPMTLFPNPSHSKLNISASADVSFDSIKVIDVHGAVLFEPKNFPVDVEPLASGFYFLEVTSGGTTQHLKFLKK